MNTLDKVYDLTIDIKNIDVKYNSYAKFFDDDRETSVIRIKLLNDKTPMNLENCIVEAYFILADNTYHNEACKIINSSEGVVELQLCQKCLVEGENIVRLSILKDNEISNTPVITYEVRKGLYSDNPSFNDDPLTPILSQMLLDIKVTKVNQIELQERYEKSLPKIEGKIKEVESLINRVDTAIASGTQDLEVKEARANKKGIVYSKLGDRLDEVDSQLEHNMNGITLLELKTDFVYPEFYGAVGDGLANDTEAFNKMLAANKPIRFIKSATYRIGNIVFPAKCDMRSDYDVILNLYQSNSENPVLLGFKSNSYFENINFISTEEDLEWNRGNITGIENVTFNRCKFEGFRHDSSTPNSWGIYIENSKDITIRKCEFENNSQSDIAIVDGCDNIILDSNYGSNFVVNIEPNGVIGKYVSNVKISNSNISKLYSLENSYTFESVKNANIECCTIENLIYRGGNLFFKGSIVKNIVDQNILYGGYVELDAMSLSHNLCESKIYDIGNSVSDGRSWYGSYSNTSNLLTRAITEAGKGLLLNDGAKQNYSSVETKVSINEGLYLIKINSQSFYSDDSVYIANHGKISFYNDTDSLLIEKNIVFNQGLQGETTIPKESHIFVNAPSNTSYCVIRLRNSSTNSTSRLLVFNFEFRKVYLGKVNKIYEDNSKIFVSGIPKSINQAGTNHIFLKGDRVYIKEPVAGGYEGYVCIESGNPGTWKGFGVIES